MMDIGYALAEIRRHGADPNWWRGRFIAHVIARFFDAFATPEWTPIIEQDWDNLIILDACRYDLFEEAIQDRSLPGTLSKRVAAGSGTPEFLSANFSDRQCHNLVYVTANPYVNTDLEERQFHAVDPVWRDGWDEELQTVTPEVMLAHTQEAAKYYPNKRIIAHFLQPHFPFIGERQFGKRKSTVIRQRALGEEETKPEDRVPTPFDRLRNGEVTRNEVWEAYRSNLERAIPAVEELLESLPGKTVVTSDHGNAFGEFAWPFPIRIYGHPLGVLIPALTEVPWLENITGERKQVTSEVPTPTERQPSERTKERLELLGYAE